MDTTLRYLAMLTLVPRQPGRIDASRLAAALCERGFAIDKRSTQRDLARLAQYFPLVCNDRTLPYLWSWSRDAPPLSAGGVDPVAALALTLADMHFSTALPSAFRRALAPTLNMAQHVLDLQANNGVGGYLRRFRVLQRGPPVLAPEIDPEVLDAVTLAVAEGRALAARYRTRTGQVREYGLHPLGLVARNPRLHLIANIAPRPPALQFLVHRFERASVLDERVDPGDFDLDEFIAAQRLGYLIGGEPVTLRARVRGSAALAVAETPFAADQRLEEIGAGEYRVEATVCDTMELRAFLLGFGAALVVEEPASLADALAAEARAMAEGYGGRTGDAR